LRLLNGPHMRRAARSLMSKVGLACSPDTLVRDLSPGQRQLVEIAHALALEGRILIMDEPSSSLSQSETDRLFEVIKQLKSHGVSAIYISHRLAEIKRIADRATVLRDGRNTGDLAGPAINQESLVRLMVGRELSMFYERQHHFAGDSTSQSSRPRLEVLDLCYAGGPTSPVSFSVRGGEIV